MRNASVMGRLKAGVVVLSVASWCCAVDAADDTWRRAAIPLATPWPQALPEAVIARLDADLAGRRFIGLGEGDHYVEEKYAYRLAFLRYLIERHGLRHVALEMGSSDAARIDRYLETGDEAHLERVVLYDYVGSTPREQRDLGTYARLPAEVRQRGRAFIAAEKRFWRGLRALSTSAGVKTGTRVRLFGFDVDMLPGGGYEDARRTLEACTRDAPVDEALAALTQPAGSAGLDEVARLDGVVRRLDALQGALAASCGGEAVARGLRDDIAHLAFSYRTMIALQAAGRDFSPTGLRTLRDIYERRERHMDQRLSAWLATLAASECVALLGHNQHLARASERLEFGPSHHSLGTWTSIGTHLATRYPGQSYVLWLLYARGSRLDGSRPPTYEAPVTRPSDSLEARLARYGDAFMLPLDALGPGSFVDRRQEFGTPTSEGTGILRGSVDALVFLPEAHAPRP